MNFAEQYVNHVATSKDVAGLMDHLTTVAVNRPLTAWFFDDGSVAIGRDGKPNVLTAMTPGISVSFGEEA